MLAILLDSLSKQVQWSNTVSVRSAWSLVIGLTAQVELVRRIMAHRLFISIGFIAIRVVLKNVVLMLFAISYMDANTRRSDVSWSSSKYVVLLVRAHDVLRLSVVFDCYYFLNSFLDLQLCDSSSSDHPHNYGDGNDN